MNKGRPFWLLFKAHVLGDLDALHDVAAYYAYEVCEGRLDKKYLVKAFRYYEYGAVRGNRECQYDYGFMLIEGEVDRQDKPQGLLWIKRAADTGHIAAKDFLADYPQ